MDYGGQRVQVAGEILGMRRTLMELQGLLQQAITSQESAHRTCAMVDGSLILWQLEGKPPHYQKTTLASYLSYLEQARQHGIPVLGYISRPRSRDVLNALRVGLCPETIPTAIAVPIPICPACPVPRSKGSATDGSLKSFYAPENVRQSLTVPRAFLRRTGTIVSASVTSMSAQKSPA